jgi:metal-responsive CopG/Arc/MetJ family transcriptional regulator
MKTVTVSLPPQLVAELDRVSERERCTPVEDALPEEIEAMRRADEEYARGECVRLEDLQRELGLRTR